MFAFVSLLVAITLTFLVVRIGSIALQMTGLSEEVARFQALSAFSGTGFTTAEADLVVNHPVRRRILRLMIEMGGAGVVTTISSLVLAFTDSGGQGQQRLLILVGTLTVLLILANTPVMSVGLNRAIQWGLKRWTTLDLKDYASLLQLHGDYSVAELEVDPADWLASAKLQDLDLPSEGVLVLGIRRRDGSFVGAPGGEAWLYPGDQLVAYGEARLLRELATRNELDVHATRRPGSALRAGPRTAVEKLEAFGSRCGTATPGSRR